MSLPKLNDIKNWSVEIERKITDEWKKSEQFAFDEKSRRKIYSIDTPPPYVNASVHIGQAITYCYMDFFARYKRMKNFQVIFPLGLDRNGLPIEMAAEKKFDVSPFKVGRKKFLEFCEKLLEETSSETADTFAKLGISFTSYKKGKYVGAVYETDSSEYRKLTQATFIELFKRGMVYEDNRINNWDPKLRTTIADSEIEYKEIPSTFNFVKWKVKETGETIVIATTRPELICTCGMVIFNPDDKRYKKFEGKTAVSPVFDREVKIKSHPFASAEKGSGLVMMCSVGDLTDIQFFREMKLKPTIAIEKDGTMNEHAGVLRGLKVREARAKIIELLKEKHLIEKQLQISHRTPVSERSGAEIEFIQMPEFYLKQLEFKEDMKKIAKKINFVPPESKKILDDWIDSIAIDWPISRRRYYATSIPLWHTGSLTAVPPAGDYYEPWKESPPKDCEIWRGGKKVGTMKDFAREKWVGEERVFDTWMDSSISELYLLKYKDDEKFFEKAFPVSLRPQGKEIVRTWLYYTLLRGYLETKKPAFEDVWIHQHILDDKGRKMSKSLGNTIDPQQLLRDFGAEAIRFWAAIEGDLSKQDLSCSQEKIRAELKTINKLLNVAKFVLQFDKPKKKPTLTKLDELYVTYIDYETYDVQWHYDRYGFYKPALKLRNFLWDTFASHYVEIVKARAYNEEKKFTQEESDSARFTLYYLLERIVILLYPIIPQVTSVIAKELKVDFDEFPTFSTQPNVGDAIALVNQIENFNRLVWKVKKEDGISLRQKVSGIAVPLELRHYKKDLEICHGLN